MNFCTYVLVWQRYTCLSELKPSAFGSARKIKVLDLRVFLQFDV